MVDHAELELMGVPIGRLPEARARVDRHLSPFRLPAGRYRIPLSYLVVTARRP